MLDDTELTIQQLQNYDIIQVGTSKIGINTPRDYTTSYNEYLELLDWFRNNTMEIAIIPILLLGEPNTDEFSRMYHSTGFIKTDLFLNGNVSTYTQTVYDVLEEES